MRGARTWRFVAVMGVMAVVAVAWPAATPRRAGAATGHTTAPILTFASVPDLFNSDIGDVRGAPGWDRGEPNSINDSYRAAAAKVLNSIARTDPDVVLVAGDLVEGRWHKDVDGTRTFGTVATHEQRVRTVHAAGRTYYSQWKKRFAARGMQVHAAVGDHEVGDNPWPVGWPKTRLVGAYKDAWARRFTRTRDGGYRYAMRPKGTRFEDTAYAFRRGPVLFVTVDVFSTRADGTMHMEVVRGQLDWLDRVLGKAADDPTIRYLIVQGHVPVLTPVRTHRSSGLSLERGAQSAFWNTLRRHRVDLYLCGEVHHVTASNAAGIEQVAHGGIIGYGNHISYLVGRVYRDHLDLTIRRAGVTSSSDPDVRLWQTSGHRPRAKVAVGSFSSVGRLTITAAGAEEDRSGVLRLYQP